MHGAGPMPYPMLQSAFDGLYPTGRAVVLAGGLRQRVTDAAMAVHARFGAELPTLKSTMHLYPIDGAAHDVGHRGHGLGVPRRDLRRGHRRRRSRPRQRRVIRRWSVDYWEALHPYSAGGAYVNLMMDEGRGARPRELPRQLRPAGAREGRLRPGQPFRVNQNIQPAP